MKSRGELLLLAAWAWLPCCTSTPAENVSDRAEDAGARAPATSNPGASNSAHPDASEALGASNSAHPDASGASTPPGSSSVPVGAGELRSPSSACGSPARIASGQSELTIESGGVRRRLLVYLPAGHAVDEALPLVFNLHGSGLTPESQLASSGLVPVANAKGFVVVAPAGLGQTWNVPPEADEPDDVQMVADALDALEARVCVDRRRVFAMGFSGGGRMSSQLACDLSSRIGAAAAVGGVRFPGPCSSARPFPILAFHGTGDDVNPYDGGGQPFWQTGVEAAIDGWAQHNACGARSEERVTGGIDRISYAGCIEVALYRLEDFGHEWPGVITNDASASDLIWSFFERHPLAP